MERYVERELLDVLPAAAPEAIESRRDLRRLNAWMGNARTLAHTLRTVDTSGGPVRLVELGAGDGDLLVKVAHRLGRRWQGTAATLVDMQHLLSAETSKKFQDAGWKVSFLKQDAFNWASEEHPDPREVVLANLFLHHFQALQLEQLLRAIRRRSIFFTALEPRRSMLGLTFSHLVRLIGCNAVTRHDATASVCAGFAGQELSVLWGQEDADWQLREGRAGLFGHLFIARKKV